MLCYVIEILMWLNIIQDMREPQIFPCAVFGLYNWAGVPKHSYCNSCKYLDDSLIAVVWYVFLLMLAYFVAKDAGLG
jgi:hypothetical protein